MNSRLLGFRTWRLVSLTVLLAVASVVPLLGKWHWFADLFSHFAGHYALIALVLSIDLVRARQIRWLPILICVMAIQAPQLLPYWTTPAHERKVQKDTEHIRVLHFNVNMQNPDPDAVVTWLESEMPNLDVIVLLEVTGSWMAPLEKLRPRFPYHLLDLRNDGSGIAIFSRLNSETLRFWQSGDSHPPSVVLNATTTHKKIPFVLYATHTPAPVSAQRSRERNQQLSALAHQIAKEPLANRILVGDLNTTTWSYWFRQLKHISGLRDGQEGFGYNGTWPAKGIPSWLGIPIDHTLVSSGIRVADWQTGPALGSDHRPVIATLTLSAPAVEVPPINDALRQNKRKANQRAGALSAS